MAEIFLKILNMSISATWMVMIILVARLLLRKAPKWISVLLWALVGLRLICPISLESVFSLIPSSETVSPEIMLAPNPAVNTGVSVLDQILNPVIAQSCTPEPINSANPLQIWIPVSANLWLLGIFVLLIYALVSYLRLKYRLREATILDGNIYLSQMRVPFVLGIVAPKIYIPYHIDERNMQYVIDHERAHIQRKDHWWKPLGYLVLSIHWFNPAIWLAYILFCRDIEMSCDEKVVKALSPEQRADYSAALLTCGTGHRIVAPCPLAFGEGRLKARVKAVLHYKQPTLWVIIGAVGLCAVIALCGLTDPITRIDGFDPYVIPVFSSVPDDLQQKSEEIKSKLDMDNGSVFQITDSNGIMYHRGTDIGQIPMTITEEEAVIKAEAYLKELGLLPKGAYRTRVGLINRTAMVLDGESAHTTEVIEAKVFFYQVFNGTDVVSDRNDGITLYFDSQGICTLQYLWRDIGSEKLPQTGQPITAEDAHQIYLQHWETLHGDCCEPTQDPIIFRMYAMFDEVMRPCWNISDGEKYANCWYIDMLTGDILSAQ